MPKPARRAPGAGRRYCVNHGRRCTWAGGPWPEQATRAEGRPEKCRQATAEDRKREVGVFRPVDYSAEPVDVGVLRLVAEADGQDGEEFERRWLAEAPARAEARRLAGEATRKRRDAQPWAEWLAEEREAVAKVDRLVAEIEAVARGEGRQHSTKEDDR